MRIAVVAFLSLCAGMASAAEVGDSFLRDFAITQRYKLGTVTAPLPTADGSAVLFVRSEPRRPWGSLYRFDVKSGQTRKLLAPEDVLKGAEEQLSAAERAQRERQRQSGRGFVDFTLSDDGKKALSMLSGRLFVIDIAAARATEVPISARPALNPRFSPDATKVAFVHDRDLYVYDLATKSERRLTRASDPGITNGMAEFAAQEELDRIDGFWWSPDGQSLAYEEADTRGVERLTLPDLAHPEQTPESPSYPRAGKQNAKLRVGVVPAGGGATRWLQWDSTRLPYLVKVEWTDQAPLSLVVMTRDQKTLQLLTADGEGRTRLLVEERDPQFLEIDPSVPRWLPDGSGFLWSSEATGTRQLELRAADGKRLKVLSSETERYVEEGVVGLDGARRVAWFVGAPSAPERQIYRVGLDGGAATAVTTGMAERSAKFGHAGPVWVERMRGTDGKPHALVHVAEARADRVVGELPSVVLAPPFPFTQELVRVGRQGLWAAVVRPRRFDPQKKYPVVVDVYGGPHHQQVTAAPSPLRQWIADRGVIVVSIDGRGTPNRGRAFAHGIAGDFSRTVDDQVEGLQALGARFKELDLGHVGIHGWSFGGYLAGLALLARPDVFAVAVAGAPVVDWRDYDTAYTERYLGMPDANRAGYDKSSLLTWAPKLQRPLLVVHGTSDDNVYFLHSLKLVDALFRAGRPVEFLPLAGFTHRVSDPLIVEQMETRVVRFLLDALLSAPKG